MQSHTVHPPGKNGPHQSAVINACCHAEDNFRVSKLNAQGFC